MQPAFSSQLVSIIMPTYNCACFIAQSVESVLAQSHTNWELIIVDDCSTDNTKAVLSPYLAKYPNIHYTCLEKNEGPAFARSTALKQAKGDYVAFLDSDDLWNPEKLTKQIAFMQEKHAGFSATAYSQMNEEGKSLETVLIPPQKTDYVKMLRLSCPIGNSTVMYDRRILGDQTVPSIQKRNDFALWLQLLHTTPVCCGLPEVLTIYRVRTKSVSSNKLKLLPYHWHLYYRIEKLGVIKSMWYILCWAFVKGTGIGINKIRAEKLHRKNVKNPVWYYE